MRQAAHPRYAIYRRTDRDDPWELSGVRCVRDDAETAVRKARRPGPEVEILCLKFPGDARIPFLVPGTHPHRVVAVP